MKLQQYLDYLVVWLQQQVKSNQVKGLILGISGGVDSAVCAALIKKAFPDLKQHLVLFMPCYSQPNDEKLVNELVTQLNLNYQIINLDNSYDNLIKSFQWDNNFQTKNKIALANCKSRLRMTTLYAFAKAYNFLVIGTSNQAEWYTGYFTKFGDGASDLAPLIHLNKQQVKEAAKLLKIPNSIILQLPSAGFWKGQTDEQDMGVSYNEIDKYLSNDNSNIDKKIIKKIEQMHNNTKHKRNPLIMPNKFN